MALDLYFDCGLGDAPADAQQLDEHHPGRIAFESMGGSGPMWMRCNIPMARGLGFSGAARVSAAALGAVQQAADADDPIGDARDAILSATAALEGHGDNVAASLYGGVTAYVDGDVSSIPVGPVFASARLVAWVPDVTTSTDDSRKALDPLVERADAVHNIGRSIQLTMALVNDDPSLLARGVADRLHQPTRLAALPGGAEALAAGLDAGAWAGWLSGSGPTVALLCPGDIAATVAGELPGNAHTKVLSIDTVGCRVQR